MNINNNIDCMNIDNLINNNNNKTISMDIGNSNIVTMKSSEMSCDALSNNTNIDFNEDSIILK